MRCQFRIFPHKILFSSKGENDGFTEESERHQLFQVIKAGITSSGTEWEEHSIISEEFLPGCMASMNSQKKNQKNHLQNERPMLFKTVKGIWQGKTEALLFQTEKTWQLKATHVPGLALDQKAKDIIGTVDEIWMGSEYWMLALSQCKFHYLECYTVVMWESILWG